MARPLPHPVSITDEYLAEVLAQLRDLTSMVRSLAAVIGGYAQAPLSTPESAPAAIEGSEGVDTVGPQATPVTVAASEPIEPEQPAPKPPTKSPDKRAARPRVRGKKKKA